MQKDELHIYRKIKNTNSIFQRVRTGFEFFKKRKRSKKLGFLSYFDFNSNKIARSFCSNLENSW